MKSTRYPDRRSALFTRQLICLKDTPDGHRVAIKLAPLPSDILHIDGTGRSTTPRSKLI